MENKKEPLMSAYRFMQKNNDKNTTELMQMYAKYVLNNAKEFVADEAKTLGKSSNGIVVWSNIDKKSIHTAIDNYIEINLNKEL